MPTETETDDAWIGPYGRRLPSPPTKIVNGRVLRRRWGVVGQRRHMLGDAEIECAYILDDGQPDVEHHWNRSPGMPSYLCVTGWTLPACFAEFKRAWGAR
ncbi:hypothetical protein EES43_24470 [Streptomyces sp. ADI96-02]|uniref:hypothetical protein n=1 Tax=Streptomyces sp. ADI96-02 TaxID=1522760 RepID=UPI000F550B53|nr:hypothetical protein [Streptomyces sp. ADI96-02]RPK56200.1 hypothetical protein EES43_24470 [Streptomyces sp. ADI96-02]